eukprot:scaffold44945_cov37-Prasinocladus_malaysianus.AAC.1
MINGQETPRLLYITIIDCDHEGSEARRSKPRDALSFGLLILDTECQPLKLEGRSWEVNGNLYRPIQQHAFDAISGFSPASVPTEPSRLRL